MKLKLKKGDSALVVAGSEKGKSGKVLAMDRLRLKVRLEGLRIQTHFDKKEGIQKKEGWIDYSNVKFLRSGSPVPKPVPKPAKKSVQK